MKKLLLLPAILVPGIAFAEPAPRIDGGFIEGKKTTQGLEGASVGVGWWSDYFGVEGELGLNKSKIEIDNTDFEDSLLLVGGLEAKAGVQFGRVKPWLGLGLQGSYLEEDTTDTDLLLLEGLFTLGSSFAVTEHLAFTMSVLQGNLILAGDAGVGSVNGLDPDGFSFSVLPSFGVAYHF